MKTLLGRALILAALAPGSNWSAISSVKAASFMEFALNGDPKNRSPGILPTVATAANRLELHFTRPAPADVTYNVQASLDLMSWSNIATLAADSTTWTGDAIVIESGSGTTRTVTVQHSALIQSTATRFLRLAVHRD